MSKPVPAPVLSEPRNPRPGTGQKCCSAQVSPPYFCAPHCTRTSNLRTPPKPFADHHTITDKTMSHELHKCPLRLASLRQPPCITTFHIPEAVPAPVLCKPRNRLMAPPPLAHYPLHASLQSPHPALAIRQPPHHYRQNNVP